MRSQCHSVNGAFADSLIGAYDDAPGAVSDYTQLYMECGKSGSFDSLATLEAVGGTPKISLKTGSGSGTERASILNAGFALQNGARIDEFSTDGTLAGNSDLAVPTEKAVKTYSDTRSGVAVRHNANQSVAASTEVALNMNTEIRDDAAFHDTVTNNTRLTVPTGMGGWYAISGGMFFAANTTGTYRQIYVKLNGTTDIVVALTAPGSSNYALNINTVYYLAAGDYIELYANHDATGAINSLTSGVFTPMFRMVRL